MALVLQVVHLLGGGPEGGWVGPPGVSGQATLRDGVEVLRTGWDFRLKEHRDAARQRFQEEAPDLLIGSPECRLFSQLQSLNKNRGDLYSFPELNKFGMTTE